MEEKDRFFGSDNEDDTERVDRPVKKDQEQSFYAVLNVSEKVDAFGLLID